MQNTTQMTDRRFGAVNWMGVYTLAWREIRRFLAVWSQTLAAPLVTAGLFLAVFTLAFGANRAPVMGVPFLHFLAPGVLMMTVVQNAFANTSNSIMISKIQGNIVDTLMPPLSASEMLVGYLAGSIARGMFVAIAIAVVMTLFLGLPVAHPLWALTFVFMGSVMLGSLGVLAGIYAQKFDQMASITNFIITPLSFLSGTFYSIERLPPAMQIATHFNPIFYLIDGVRYGMIGVSDSSPWLGVSVCLGVCVVICGLAWTWLRSGYRLKP